MYKDLNELLKSLPGAAKAVAHLVTETGNVGAALLRIGTAKAKQRVQSIDDETAARSKMSKALTRAAEKYIAANAGDLGKRAVDYGIRRIIQNQINREAVAALALRNLLHDPPEEAPETTPDDDWLNVFGSHAEKATSDTMRQHWSQILSGEIRKPGSFSIATLELAAIMDRRVATTIQAVCPWIVDKDYVPTIEELNEGEFYSQLLTLDSVNFLRASGASKFYNAGPAGRIAVSLGSKTILAVGQPNQRFLINAAFLTLSGRELLNIISYEEHPELQKKLTRALESQGATNFQIRER